jgi:hypothetical protein
MTASDAGRGVDGSELGAVDASGAHSQDAEPHEASVDAPASSDVDARADRPTIGDGAVMDSRTNDALNAPPSFAACRLCPVGHRWCNGRCIAPSDPLEGCGSWCFPCAFANGTGRCDANGQCSLAQCEPGSADCNRDPVDGCETDLGATIGARCNAIVCRAGLTLCTTADGAQACVDTMRDPGHCGGCNNACVGDDENGYPVCSNGACAKACPPGWSSCGGTCVHLSSDASNCKACGHACAPGEYCSFGDCHPGNHQVVAAGLQQPEDVVASGDQVFFTTIGDGGIYRVVAIGGQPVALTTGKGKPTRLAADDTYVYWVNDLGGPIMRVSRDGRGAVEIAADATKPSAIALDGDSLYWIDEQLPGRRSVRRARKGANMIGAEVGGALRSDTSELFIFDHVLYAFGAALHRINLVDGQDPSPVIDGVSAFATDADHQFQASPATLGGGVFRWSSRKDDGESGVGKIRGDTLVQLAPAPCGALFVSSSGAVGFLPLLPGAPVGSGEWMAPLPLRGGVAGHTARRIVYSGGYGYWTEAGAEPGTGAVYRTLTPL